MTNTKKRVERRKHRRFRVQEGAYVILSPSDTGAGRLKNISMGGLMFEYVSVKAPSINATELEIFVTDSLFRLHQIPCQSVWDLPIYKSPTFSLQKRRCGVQFGDLSPHQLSRLEYFIQNHTTGEA
jgi:hypothetical protein